MQGMFSYERNLDFVRRAAAELAVSFTDPRDHNLHAVINGLLSAIERDRARIAALEKLCGQSACAQSVDR